MSTQLRALMGARLKEERNRLELSQDEFGLLCDVKRRTLQDWERGVNAPSGDFLAAAHQHGVDVLYIVAGVRSRALTPEALTPDEQSLVLHYAEIRETLRPAVLNLVREMARDS